MYFDRRTVCLDLQTERGTTVYLTLKDVRMRSFPTDGGVIELTEEQAEQMETAGTQLCANVINGQTGGMIKQRITQAAKKPVPEAYTEMGPETMPTFNSGVHEYKGTYQLKLRGNLDRAATLEKGVRKPKGFRWCKEKKPTTVKLKMIVAAKMFIQDARAYVEPTFTPTLIDILDRPDTMTSYCEEDMTFYDGDNDTDEDTTGEKRAADREGVTEPPAKKAAGGW